MKHLVFSLFVLFPAFGAFAQFDVPGDGGNLKASVSEDVGITNISIKYSRPAVKGREGKIWGGVVANGFNVFNVGAGRATSPWRAGANEATVISFEHDVQVEGKDLKAGSYALFMAMGMDTTIVIFSKQTEAWGSFFYRPEDDVLRIHVKPVTMEKSVERLKYEFINQTEKSCVVTMQWEKLMVPFKVDVDVENIVLNRVRQELIGPKGFSSGNLIQASRYFFNRNTNLAEALSWAKRAVTGQPMAQTAYDTYRNLAIGYEKLNHIKEADSIMNLILPTANIIQHVGYGRAMINQKRADRSLEVLLNAQKIYGDVYAVNNALSYAYSAKGDFTKALVFANKALSQAQSPQQKSASTANIEKLKAKTDIN